MMAFNFCQCVSASQQHKTISGSGGSFTRLCNICSSQSLWSNTALTQKDAYNLEKLEMQKKRRAKIQVTDKIQTALSKEHTAFAASKKQ